MNVVDTVTFFSDGDGRPRVIRYYARNHRILGFNLL